MRELELWRFVQRQVSSGHAAGLLIVVDHQGSSPGRKGFKMAIAADGHMQGSIGGGIMEHKLVELTKDRLQKGLHFWEIKRQIHSKEAPADQSGMICSGEQTIAILAIAPHHHAAVAEIVAHLEDSQSISLKFDEAGWRILPKATSRATKAFWQQSVQNWSYEETIGLADIVHVIGAGHVGLELCRVLANLDFFVINYDDRPDLNTMLANQFAHQKIVTPYPDLSNQITPGPNAYVIIATFGYRGDNEAIRALIGMEFKYLGMMGSEAKVKKLLADLLQDGYSAAQIAKVRTPAGLVSHCKTPAEIAVSIAAEMLSVRYHPKETPI